MEKTDKQKVEHLISSIHADLTLARAYIQFNADMMVVEPTMAVDPAFYKIVLEHALRSLRADLETMSIVKNMKNSGGGA